MSFISYNFRDGIKSISENLEPTVEITTSSNVCPWDTIIEQQPQQQQTLSTLLSVTAPRQPSSVGAIVSVSVCPWDDNNSNVTETSEGNGKQDVDEGAAASCGCVGGDVDISNNSASTSIKVTATTTTTTTFGRNSFKYIISFYIKHKNSFIFFLFSKLFYKKKN